MRGRDSPDAAPAGRAQGRGMKAIPLIASDVSVCALAGTAQAASHPQEAYFRVDIRASQAGNWKKDLTSNGCGGPSWVRGGGDSSLRLSSPEPVTVVARRVSSPEKVQFIVGRSGGGIPVTGNVVRQGELSGGFLRPPPPGVCPRPEPTPIDCGSRNYPPGSTINIQFDTPKSWKDEFYGQPPLVP